MENLSKPSVTNESLSSGDDLMFRETKGDAGDDKTFVKVDAGNDEAFRESRLHDLRLPPSGLNRAENLSPEEFPPPTGEDKERMDAALEDFREENWENLSLEEKEQFIRDLADLIADETGNKNPPKIVFRDDLDDRKGGWHDGETNTIVINEKMIDDPCRAVEITAHEMWHAHQYQCTMDPASEKGPEYKDAFDNYISPEYDYEGYRNQMVEVEARDFAQVYVDELAKMEGAV